MIWKAQYRYIIATQFVRLCPLFLSLVLTLAVNASCSISGLSVLIRTPQIPAPLRKQPGTPTENVTDSPKQVGLGLGPWSPHQHNGHYQHLDLGSQQNQECPQQLWVWGVKLQTDKSCTGAVGRTWHSFIWVQSTVQNPRTQMGKQLTWVTELERGPQLPRGGLGLYSVWVQTPIVHVSLPYSVSSWGKIRLVGSSESGIWWEVNLGGKTLTLHFHTRIQSRVPGGWGCEQAVKP